MANDNYQQHGTGTAPDAPGPCMHSIMGHMCKAHGGPKDTCDCYPAPGAPDALAADCRAMATACDTLGHRDCAYTLRQAAQRIEALQAVADAARDVLATVSSIPKSMLYSVSPRQVTALEAALAKLEEPSMTNIDYTALRELCEAATPGPLKLRIYPASDHGKGHLVMTAPDDSREMQVALVFRGDEGDPTWKRCCADYHLFAASRTALPALLDRIDAIRKLAAEAEHLLSCREAEAKVEAESGAEYRPAAYSAYGALREAETLRAVIAILEGADGTPDPAKEERHVD